MAHACAVADPPQRSIEQAVSEHLPAAVADLQAWIRHRSVTDADDSYRAAKTELLRAVVARARDLGLEARLVADRRAAIVDLGDLSDLSRAIGILVHADVVPADPAAGWDAPPFSGALIDGVVYGRGAADDKGPMAATLYAMAIIRELGLPLAGGVRLIVGTSEENMVWDDMVAVAEAGLVPAQGWTADAAFPVINAEKSFVNATVFFDRRPGEDRSLRGLQGGLAPNAVAAAAGVSLQATPATHAALRAALATRGTPAGEAEIALAAEGTDLRLTAVGRAAHGSRPADGINAVTHLVRFLRAVGLPDTGDESAEARALRFISRAIGTETDGARLGIARQHEIMGPTTVNLGMVESNAAAVVLRFNIRGPAGLAVDEITTALDRAAAPDGGAVTLDASMEPLYVDPDTPLVRTLQASYAASTGETPRLLAIGGTTYAKAYPGYVAFGMGFIGESGPVHAPNERLRVDHLERGMLIYIDAIVRAAAMAHRSGRSGNMQDSRSVGFR